jgi:hypothetical protein
MVKSKKAKSKKARSKPARNHTENAKKEPVIKLNTNWIITSKTGADILNNLLKDINK